MYNLYKIVCDYKVLEYDSISEEDILHWEKVDDELVDLYLLKDDLVTNGHHCETHINVLTVGMPITYIIDIEHECYTYINNRNVRRFIKLFDLNIS